MQAEDAGAYLQRGSSGNSEARKELGGLHLRSESGGITPHKRASKRDYWTGSRRSTRLLKIPTVRSRLGGR
jgi:hypothetical protein